jgi:acetyl esterase/lipase
VAIISTTMNFAAETREFPPDTSVTYKMVGDKELKLHIFYPEGHSPSDCRPAIVFFFGGGWQNGSPTQFYPHCEYLASRGIVAMAADYRVKFRDQTTPQECVKDGKSAIRCDLHVYAGQPHGFFNYRNWDNFQQTVLEMDRFLASLGYLEGEPTVPPLAR